MDPRFIHTALILRIFILLSLKAQNVQIKRQINRIEAPLFRAALQEQCRDLAEDTDMVEVSVMNDGGSNCPLFTRALLAKRLLSRGEKLGRDEAVSYIAASLFEDAHRGCTADELKNIGYGMLRRSEAVSGVPETISPLSVKLDLFTGPAVITIESPFAD